jgi:hypothetical protein
VWHVEFKTHYNDLDSEECKALALAAWNEAPRKITQPLIKDESGVERFQSNAIVQYLAFSHPTCNMNALVKMSFSEDDRRQFCQLIGYSLGGYLDLFDDEASQDERIKK